MKKTIIILLTFGIMLLVGCTTQPVNTTTRIEGNNFLWYKYNSEFPNECVLDVYRKDTKVRPAVLMIYGSAWMDLRKVMNRDIIAQDKDLFLDNGYHVINIDHRRIKLDATNDSIAQPTYRDMLDDVKSAIQFIKDNAEEFTIDTSYIILHGHSSGAHLAELYSYSVEDSPIPVKLCIAKSGPSDFTNQKFRTCDVFGFTNDMKLRKQVSNLVKLFTFSKRKPEEVDDEELAAPFRVFLVSKLFGIEADLSSDINTIADAPQNQTVINDASPLYHVKQKIANNEMSKIPYTILLHGEEDSLVDFSMSNDLYDTLKKSVSDNNVKYITMPHSGHDLSSNLDDDKMEEFKNTVAEVINAIKPPNLGDPTSDNQ